MADTPATRLNGAALTSLVTCPVPSGAGGLWWDGNTTGPKWRKADGSDVTLSSASTGNYTFSANNVTLTGAATATMFTSTATGLTIGGSNLTSGFTITGGAASTVTTTSGSLNVTAAGTVNVNNSSGSVVLGNTSNIVTLRGGSASSFDFSAGSGVFKTTTGAHTFGSASWAIPANTVITGGSSALNTTAVQNTVTLADGASGVGFAFKNATATTSAILMGFQTSTGTLEGQIELDTILPGSFVLRQPSTTYMGFLDSSNNGFKIQSGVTYFRSGGADQFQVSSSDLSGAAASTQTIGVNNSLARVVSKRFVPGLFVVTSSATPAFDPANGDKQRMILTANVTSWTFAAGQAGETVTIEFIQDATGSRTLSGTPANVKLAGGALTLSTGANKRDLITFAYDSTDSAWIEQSRSLNC